VLGTGLPEIFYDYRIEPLDDSRWAVDGEARQESTYVYRYEVVERPDGRLDVARRAEQRLDINDSVLVVPFQIGMADGADGDRAASADRFRRLLTGRVVLSGVTSAFRLEVDERPEIFWLDRNGEVFGRFFATSRWPRRSALERGLSYAASGAEESAEAEWLAAFGLEVVTVDERLLGIDVDVEAATRIVDTSLDLALARLYLDGGRLDEAADRIGSARERMRRQDAWRFDSDLLALEARLAIRSGRADLAARQLRKELGRDREGATAETAALLAIASSLTEREDDFEEACRDARERGVDLGPLACPTNG